MKKKVTLRDIAEEAGVSVATVSYILNNRDDQCISEATRNKVLQIVNLYGYQLNFSAKAISGGKSNIVAIYLGHGSFALQRAENMLLVRRLAKHLKDSGLMLRVVDNNDTSRLNFCDAAICCDQEESFFKTVSEANFCPVIALDMLFDDQLFCQVNNNYRKILEVAKKIYGETSFTVVSCEVHNNLLRKEMQTIFPQLVFVKSFEELAPLQGQNIVALGEMLGQFCKSVNSNTLSIDIHSHEKLDVLLHCLDLTINRTGDVQHDVRI